MKPDTEVMPYHKIRIHKGTEFHTTHPQKDGPQVVKRTYVTQTRTSSCRHTEDVTWCGSGGYWCWAKKSDVELLGT